MYFSMASYQLRFRQYSPTVNGLNPDEPNQNSISPYRALNLATRLKSARGFRKSSHPSIHPEIQRSRESPGPISWEKNFSKSTVTSNMQLLNSNAVAMIHSTKAYVLQEAPDRQ